MENLASSLAANCVGSSPTEILEAVRRAEQQVRKASLANLESGMGKLSLPAHSIPMAAFLRAKLNQLSAENRDGLLGQLEEFTLGADPEHIRVAVDIYSDLYSNLAQHLVKATSPPPPLAAQAIEVVKAGLRNLQRGPGEMTPLHADLCLLALKAGELEAVREILDEDIEGICDWVKGAAFPAKAFLLYFYYGGLVYAGLGLYPRALHFFEMALTTPATAVSAIMLEAYKAHLLLALLIHGKLEQLPKYVSPVVSRYLKPAASAYHELAAAYAQGDPGALLALQAKHWPPGPGAPHLHRLVQRVLRSLYKRNVERLARSFVTLSLDDVARRAKLPGGATEAATLLREMSDEGWLAVEVEADTGLVHFRQAQAKSPASEAEVEACLEEAMRLAALVNRLDNDLATNPTYVQRLNRSSYGGGGFGGLGFHDDEGVSISLGAPPAPYDLHAPFTPQF